MGYNIDSAQFKVGDGSTPWNEIPYTADQVEFFLNSVETVTVGSAGDFATINEALAEVTKKYPSYASETVIPRVTIELLAGFVMSEQVIVDGQNLSWITISSVDAEVVINSSALTEVNANELKPAFTAQNGGFAPIINVLFDIDDTGPDNDKGGLQVFNNSKAIVLPGKGFKNSSSFGIYANEGSIVNATDANVSGAFSVGIFADNGSTINAPNVNASEASYSGIWADNGSYINAFNADTSGLYGVYADNGSYINASNANTSGVYNIYADNGSKINAFNADASNSSYNGICADNGSYINASNADTSGVYGVYADNGSEINAPGVDASGAVTYGIYAEHDSKINATNANASGMGTYGIFAGNGSEINAPGVNASGAFVYGIYANNGSTINADSADASGVSTDGIRADNGSEINTPDVNASGAGTHGIYAGRGSKINAFNANASNANTMGVYADDGSEINAPGVNASGAGIHGIYAVGFSTINAGGANASNAGSMGVYANDGSEINAFNANASDASVMGVLADNASYINASGADASGAGAHGIYAAVGSEINAPGVDASGAGVYGIYANSGSEINASGADASGADTHGIYADNGSEINAFNANASGASVYGIHANNGSTINASNADASGAGTIDIFGTGGSTINIADVTANTIDVESISFEDVSEYKQDYVVNPSEEGEGEWFENTNIPFTATDIGLGKVNLYLNDILIISNGEGVTANYAAANIDYIDFSGTPGEDQAFSVEFELTDESWFNVEYKTFESSTADVVVRFEQVKPDNKVVDLINDTPFNEKQIAEIKKSSKVLKEAVEIELQADTDPQHVLNFSLDTLRNDCVVYFGDQIIWFFGEFATQNLIKNGLSAGHTTSTQSIIHNRVAVNKQIFLNETGPEEVTILSTISSAELAELPETKIIIEHFKEVQEPTIFSSDSYLALEFNEGTSQYESGFIPIQGFGPAIPQEAGNVGLTFVIDTIQSVSPQLTLFDDEKEVVAELNTLPNSPITAGEGQTFNVSKGALDLIPDGRPEVAFIKIRFAQAGPPPWTPSNLRDVVADGYAVPNPEPQEEFGFFKTYYDKHGNVVRGENEETLDETLSINGEGKLQVEGIVEKNNNDTVSFWSGTQQEYDNLSEYEENVIYFITEPEE